jgi:predicted phosphate transport protein (TIGR00153 family)
VLKRRHPGAGRRGSGIVELLRAASANGAEAGELLVQLFERWDDRAAIAAEIRDLEHRGDALTHDALVASARSLVLPFDRHDIHRLAGALDDIVDLIEEVADLIGLYAIEAPMDQAQELATITRDAARAVARAMAAMERPDEVRAHVRSIRDLEHEGDRVVRGALAALFHQGIDPMAVIRWKDLFDRLEEAVDACKKAGHQLDSILSKHN